jgi:hypothetical protein
MGFIKSINWTYTPTLDNLRLMDSHEQSQELKTEPSAHECECPDPCNCDHDNE